MYRRAEVRELGRAEFEAARLGFVQVLRRKMSPQFIERHADDLLAQAAFEYSRQVAEGKEIRNPVGWMIRCGWLRTISLLESQDWTPEFVSTERAAELVDEARDPEEAFLTGDRYRKVREAVEELPTYQRQLLALSYFDDESIREAARQLGWTPSKAQRAHESARRRLHKLLDVESPEALQFEIGVVAYASLAGGHAAGISVPAGIEAAVDQVGRLADGAVHFMRHPIGTTQGATAITSKEGSRRLPELSRRLLGSGAAEAGAAAASDGGMRAMEVCKYVACALSAGAVATAVVAPGHQQAPVRPVRTEQNLKTVASVSEAPIEVSSTVTKEGPRTTSTGEPPAPASAEPEATESEAERQATARQYESKKAERQFSAGSVAATEADNESGAKPGPSGDSPGAIASSSRTNTASRSGSSSSAPPSSSGVEREGGEAEKQAEKQVLGALR